MLMLFKSIRSWSFFSFLLLVATTLFSIIFTKYLDSIFIAVLSIHNKFQTKLFDQTEKNFESDVNEEDESNVITSDTPEMVELIQLCKFLENILDMKQLMQSSNEVNIDFSLMNEIYPELQSNKEKIRYGYFVSNFYYQKGKFKDCWNSIRTIKDVLEEEKEKLRQENDNLEIEMINLLAKYPYINEFFDNSKLFDVKEISVQQYYYELLIISEKLYFMFAICYMVKAKELKRENKVLYQNKIRESQREKPAHLMMSTRVKRLQTSKRIGGSRRDSNIDFPINKLEIEYEENKKDIIGYYETAIVYFFRSYEINHKFSINKIQLIVILIYICKCYLYLGKTWDAIENIKKSLVSLFTLNQNFVELNGRINLNPRIMLLVNGAIIEQILYYIGYINKGMKKKLSAQIFLTVLSVSYFKTDNIQSKASKHLVSLIYDYKKKKESKIDFLDKISNRLSPSRRKILKKNIFVFFSPELVRILPSKIEICDLVAKCIKKYMNDNDKVLFSRFDNFDDVQLKKVSEFTIDSVMKIINDKYRNPISKYGMQEAISYAVSKLNEKKENEESSSSGSDTKRNEDNYIFQFILSTDYIFSSHDENKKFKQKLTDSKVSLYTLVFDTTVLEGKRESEEIQKIKREKKGRIIHSIKQLTEGVLLLVKNFSTVKSAFQNISRNYKQKNMFNINFDLCKDVYFDYHS